MKLQSGSSERSMELIKLLSRFIEKKNRLKEHYLPVSEVKQGILI
jgi:hypothetical protein